MKRILLHLSVFTVSLLLVLVVRGVKQTDLQTSPALDVTGQPSITQPSSSLISASPDKVERITWQSLGSGKYAKYVSNLRRIGCPEQTLRDIIQADLHKSIRSRLGLLGSEYKPYWTSTYRTNEFLAELEKLDEERITKYQELLGETPTPDPALQQIPSRRAIALARLPEDLAARVEELENQFNAQKSAFGIKSGWVPPDKIGDSIQLGKEYSKRLTEILGNQLKEDYELQVSVSARLLREELSEFNPTAEEFHSIYKILRDGGVAEVPKQLESQLGQERYQEYLRSREAGQAKRMDSLSNSED